MNESILKVLQMSGSYGSKNIISDVNLHIKRGELAALIGNNGCGKSTLLKAILNLIPHKGYGIINPSGNKDINIEKLSAKKRASYISYIPQRTGISMSMSVIDVCMMGYNPYINILSNPGKYMKENAFRVLDKVGLKERALDDFFTLSEGQKQLCILARTIIQNAPILLLDEPESALDFTNRYEFMRMIKSIITNDKAGIISLHNPELALEFCDRLILMKDGNIVDTINVHNASISQLNKGLSSLYNDIEVVECKDKRNKVHKCIISCV